MSELSDEKAAAAREESAEAENDEGIFRTNTD